MKTKLKSIKALKREWNRLINWDLDDSKLLALGLQAVKLFITPEQFRFKIALIDIENYQGFLDDDFAYTCQAAYNVDKRIYTRQVSEWTTKAFGDCDVDIKLKCPKCKEFKCDCAVLEISLDDMEKQAHSIGFAKHFHKFGGITELGVSSFYHPGFYLMKERSGYFSNLNYHIKDCINRNIECDITYEIVDGEKIVPNFKEGQVLLSYFAYPTDSEGNLLVPDVEEAWEAIIYFIAERISFAEYLVDPESKNERRWRNMLGERSKHMGRARMRLKIPDPETYEKIVSNHWNKVIPYNDYWENSNRHQSDQFNKQWS